MKAFGILITVLMSVAALARTEYSSGTGFGSGYCGGSMGGPFCLDNLKQQARRDAVSRAELDCRVRGGTPQGSYTASCGFEYCSPSYIPPNAQNQYVSCRSECRLGCEMKDPNQLDLPASEEFETQLEESQGE